MTPEHEGQIAAELSGIQRELGRLAGALEALDRKVDIAIAASHSAFDEAQRCNIALARHLGQPDPTAPFRSDEAPTHPETPQSIAPHRRSAASLHGDELADASDDDGDRPSVLTQRISVGAGKVGYRGPAVIGLALAAIAAAAAVLMHGRLALPF